MEIQFIMEIQFSQACYNGDIMFAKKLLNDNPNINISARDECAFRYACGMGHLEIAKWLLEIQPQINISVQDDCAFRYVCYKGYLEIAKWLLEIRPQINISAENECAFKWACLYGNLKVVKWLQTLKPYLYEINYNAKGEYVSHYIRTKEEARWQQTKYLVWLSSPHSPNKQCVWFKLPNDISRYIIQNFI